MNKKLRSIVLPLSILCFTITSLILIFNFLIYNATNSIFYLYISLFVLEFVGGGLLGVTNSHDMKTLTNIIFGIMMLGVLAIMVMSGLFIYKTIASSGIVSFIWIMSIVIFWISVVSM